MFRRHETSKHETSKTQETQTGTHQAQTGDVTGTNDKDYDLFRYIEGCLRTAQRMETYRRDAEESNDTALAALFTMTQNDSRKGAEIGKKLLASRLSAADSTGADHGTGTSADYGTGAGYGTGTEADDLARPETARTAGVWPTDVMAAAPAPSRTGSAERGEGTDGIAER